MKVIYLKWLDASKQLREGLDIRDTEYVPMVLEISGILLSENNDAYSIAMQHNITDNAYDYVYHIPKRYVLKKKVVTI